MSANAVALEKQRIFSMIESMPPRLLFNLAQSIEEILEKEEEADLAFCQDMYDRAIADPDNAEGICIFELAKKWDIDLETSDED
ncbi:MAG: hypothetical protein FWB74_06310 [Defluviitaleaceae bacterium]|nr:hypothetical protein [Defluviitaleaceae bacterium]